MLHFFLNVKQLDFQLTNFYTKIFFLFVDHVKKLALFLHFVKNHMFLHKKSYLRLFSFINKNTYYFSLNVIEKEHRLALAGIFFVKSSLKRGRKRPLKHFFFFFKFSCFIEKKNAFLNFPVWILQLPITLIIKQFLICMNQKTSDAAKEK